MSATYADPQAARDEKPGGIPTPPDIADRVTRGRKAMLKDATLRRLCHKFWRGEHYWYLDAQQQMRVLPTAIIDVTGGKPAHRVRNTYNYPQLIIEGKVSAATGKVPGYEINPSSSDATARAGARIGEQVAFWGYDEWRLRRMTTKVVTSAFVEREGFAMPYASVDAKGVPMVKTWSGTRSEVMWEPDMDFDESPWHAIERAVLVSEIREMPGYIGGALAANATTADLPSQRRSEKMAVLTDYQERPTKRYPDGRRCFIAGGRIIVDFRQDPSAPEGADWWEPFPFLDADGVVTDAPAIHRLSYTVNPHDDEDDMGLMERIVDLARTIDDCWNKLLEWKNRVLMPRRSVPRSVNATQTNDVPGGSDFYDIDPINPLAKPEWERTAPIPRELFDMLTMAIEQLRALSSDVDVQPDPRLTAETASTSVEQSQARWQSFMGDLAEFHSKFMRHCLCIVARYFTEEQIAEVRGRYGYEPTVAFTGAELHSQVSVRVNPGSLLSKTRSQTRQDIMFMQQAFPGALSPEAAWSALHGGDGESLLHTWDADRSKANDVCVRLRGGPAAAQAFGWRLDMDFGDPALGYMVPGWMPRKVDNVAIWKQIFGDFMKNDMYGGLPPETQHLYDLVYDALDEQESQRKMQMAAQEQDAAAMLGGANAARPQLPIPGPASQGPLSPAQASPTATTPNQ